MEKLSLDFTEYLSERLALPGPQVSSLLGHWLLNYEPVSSLDDESPLGALSAGATSPALQATG